MQKFGSVPSLQIVVARHCWTCEQAQKLAVEAATRFPTMDVEVIDLEEEPSRRPAAVFAVPTYLMDGRVISLGNPKPEQLFEILATRLKDGVAAPRTRARPS